MKNLISVLVVCTMLAGCSQQGTLDEIADITADTEVTTAVTANGVTTEPVITTAAAATTAEKTRATEKVTNAEEITTAPVTTTTTQAPAPAPVITTTTPAPAPVVTTTAAPTSTVTPSSDIESLLNGAKLNPMKTGDSIVGSAADEILAKVSTSGMSTYQKLKAVYDYIISNYTYGSFGYDKAYTSEVYFRCMLDNIICSQAYSLVKNKMGVCDNYSALFVVLTRRIGLESYLVSGQVSKKGGGTTGHTWVIIKVGSEYYTFDPQVEQDNLNNGRITYRYFGRLESDMVNTYEYSARGGYWDICAMFYDDGEEHFFDNARDYEIFLFGNFEILEGERPYAGWIVW